MSRRRLSWRTRIYILAGLVAGVAGVALYLMPRPVTEIVSIDGQHRWREGAAPPRRKIVWQPSTSIDAVPEDGSPGDSILRPCLAEGGSVLYFTRRREDGTSDIYQSRLEDGRWQPAHPIHELNSDSDDIGPTIAADGRTLYLCSNRPGGVGGFDIYVARRTDNQWSEPQNLGPGINTPAHDQDAALSADGEVLYFSSNRTPRMQREIGLPRVDATEEEEDKPWSATLRADQGLQQFDLYVAERDEEANTWQKPYRLGGANTRIASEGEPFASSSGVFLYFASNRPNASGDLDNFDIYRGRIVPGGLVDIENLGSGVNSDADEHEPALSTEGFRIVFSTNRVDGEDAEASRPEDLDAIYVLHESVAVETYEDMAWDASRLNAWIAWINNNMWGILTALLLLALLASLIWYTREVSLGRATVPGFVLAALLIHLMLGLGSFFVYFSDDIVATIENAMEEVLVASNLHQSHEAGQASYEKVADLESVETVQPTEVFRQTTEMSSVPIPTESRIPALPTTVGPEVPQQQLAETPQAKRLENPELQRRRFRPASEMIAQETVELQQTKAVDPQQSSQPTSNEVVVNRQSTTSPKMQTPQNTPVHTSQPTRVEPVRPERVQQTAQQPATSSLAKAKLPTRTRANPMDFADARPTIQPVEVTATPSTTESTDSIRGPAVEFSRSATEQLSLNDVRMPTNMTNGQPAIDSQVRADQITVQPSDRASVPLPSGDESATPLETTMATLPTRSLAKPSLSDIAEGEVMVTQVPQSESGSSTSESAARPSEDVAVSRRNGDGPVAPTQSLRPMSERVAPVSAPTADIQTPVSSTAVNSPSAKAPLNPLSRRTTARDVSPAAVGEIAMVDAAIFEESSSPSDQSQSIATTSVRVARSQADPLQMPIPKSSRLGGRTLPRNPSVVIGTLAREANHVTPSFSPITSQIMRRPARAPLLDYAEDNIGLQSMLRLRGADLETKQDLVQAFGGDDRVLETIARGLNWIQQHQHPDGHWSLHRFQECCEGHRCNGHGDHDSDTGGTGLALLPLLGDGHTHITGDYQSNVKRALDWLVQHQKDDGDLFTGGHGNARMYSHGIATIALCEAYGMTKDPELRTPAQEALNFIVYAQHNEGGWRYAPKQAGDTSVMGWQIMAMKSGQMAGLQVPTATLDKARQWLHKNEGRGNNVGRFAYQGSNGTPPMTAEALLCLQYLGASRDDPHVLSGTRYMLENLPRSGDESSYYWYYGTQVMYHMQGEYWQQWNDRLRDMVIESQVRDGSMAGTWDPKDRWEKSGGRLYSTALRLLMLEVYYRHLPLYQALR